jgi:hypothetical protein
MLTSKFYISYDDIVDIILILLRNMKKLTLEHIYNYFKEQGCELLEKEYKNAHVLMEYKCQCGIINKINFNNFKEGKRCKKCGGNEKPMFENVFKYFKEQGCELLEKEYKNNGTKMTYLCNCGNISKITFNNFKSGKRCKKCSGKERLTFEYVYSYFKENDCELLEKEYKNSSTPLKYRCSCGETNKIRFNSFQKGSRCKKCGIEKNKGENNPNYNPNLTDKERSRNENRCKHTVYKKWRNEVFKRDSFICQNCEDSKGGNLNAHHIYNWIDNEELRHVVSNGITLCKKCHIKFHHIYGSRYTTKKQLEEFLNKKILNTPPVLLINL